MSTRSEITTRARFDRVRYAQCWEDADVLLAALNIRPGDTCLSIASAGDNTLAMAGAGAGRVIAVDLNPAQIACLELRVAACRELDYGQFMALVGQDPCEDRVALYRRCRGLLSAQSRHFWDSRPGAIRQGFARAGKFEHFLDAFRSWLLPFVAGRQTVDTLFTLPDRDERQSFYDKQWNNRRWRLLCRLFFGQASLGRFGRDPSFTRYADESVWAHLQRRIPQALVVQKPADNPYLQWILRGRFESAFPWAWRAENYERIRNNLDAIEWHCAPLEAVLADLPDRSLDGCNLSDIFEYMSPQAYHALLAELVRASAPGCRFVYWNVVVDRSRPVPLANALKPKTALARTLHAADKAFFYRRLVVEEVL